MQRLVELFTLVLALQATLVFSIPRPNLINTMDNDIPTINQPVPVSEVRKYVDITEPPSTPPEPHRFGYITELNCTAIGHPAPHIQWLKNDMPILEDEAENNEILLADDSSFVTVLGTLQIVAMSDNQQDVYTCVAQSLSNTAAASTTVYNDLESIPSMYGSLAALNRRLLTAPRKPRVVEFAKMYMARHGSVAVLPCRVAGQPRPELYWHDKDGNVVRSEGRIRVLDSGELVIEEATWSDLGAYTCTAKNAFGKESETTFFYPLGKQSNYARRRYKN